MRQPRLALAGLVCCTILGCEAPQPREVNMSLNAVNTADKILVLEGETDLPPGSKLTAELRSRDGKTLLRDEGTVRQGSFFFDFDLERLNEFSAYRAVVVFQPERAPLAVRHRVGLWGEALQGAGVHKDADGHRFFQAETEVLLSTSAKGRDWEGRDFEEMEQAERSQLIGQLERFLEEKPDNKIAKLALAKAYLADDPKEYAMGSRAHGLLVDAGRSLDSDRNGRAARVLLAKLEAAERQKIKKAEQRKAEASGARFRKDFVIQPGSKLGGFKLGSPYRIAVRYFKLDRAAYFSGREDQTVVLKDFHNTELTYGAKSRRLIAARTESPKFRLPEGLGVGSLLQELQKAYGTKAVYTPEYKLVETAGDGTKFYRGIVKTDGLIFEIRRKVDASFGIPVDKVSAITVTR